MIRGNTPPCLADLPTRAYPLPSNSLEIWMPPSYWHHQKVSNWLCASGNGFIDWSQLRFSSLYSLHAFAMSHLFTNLRCIPLSVLLALIGGVLLVGSSGMETLKNFAYRSYIADILAVLKIVGSTAAALSLVLYLIRRTRAPFTRQSLAMIGLHAGLLAMVVSMGLDFALGFKGFVYIREGESAATWFDDAGNERPLGFLVECLNFKLDVYPGTTRPERYASTIRFSSSRDDTVPASSLLLAVNSPHPIKASRFISRTAALHLEKTAPWK